MLGLVEDDLLDALGIDVVGLAAPENIFGFANEIGALIPSIQDCRSWYRNTCKRPATKTAIH
jgi:hypothetical protein